MLEESLSSWIDLHRVHVITCSSLFSKAFAVDRYLVSMGLVDRICILNRWRLEVLGQRVCHLGGCRLGKVRHG